MRKLATTPLVRTICLSALAGLAAHTSAIAQTPELAPVIIEPGFGAALNAAEASDETVLRIEMFGRVLVLTLEDSGVVTDGTQSVEIASDGVESVAPDARYYRGFVEGESDSWVRLSESNGQYAGLISVDGDVIVVEPADLWAMAQTNSSHVAYHLDEVELEDDACGAAHSPATRSARRHERRQRGDSDDELGAALQAVGGLITTEIAVVGDYEFFAASNWPGGYTASSWMAAVINAVSGIYERDLGITFAISTSTVYSTSNDPFLLTPTGTGCQTGLLATNVLGEFANTRSSGQYPWSLANSDVAHLFTGRPLCGSSGSNPQNVIGIAYYNGICSSGSGTGVSEDWTTGIGSMTILVSHELGHNFNAPHTSNCSPYACCVMEPGLGGSCVQDHFSAGSVSTISDYAAGRSCLSSGPTPTPTHTFTPSNTPTHSHTPTRTPTYTNTPTPTPPPVNLALGRPASQSSTSAGGVPSRAVDGNTSGNWLDASVTHTRNMAGSWWEVDLGSIATIERIDLFNRTDCCGERLSDFWVMVSDTPSPQVGQNNFQLYRGSQVGVSLTIPANTTGRYVRIQLDTGGILSLAEVQVWGNPDGPPPTLENVSLGKTTSQSSTKAGGVSSRAVDGNPSGNWGDGSVTHTYNELGAWWEVDLGGQADIETINIYNRTDCCGQRLGNFYVMVSDSPAPFPGQSGIFQYFESGEAGTLTSVPVGASGRYVRIQLSGADILSLAEVEVLGYSSGPPPAESLSEGKPTFQSSTGYGGVSSRAVDGNPSGNWGDGSVTHTTNDAGAWWEVDLGQVVEIDTIDIYNRTDCCSLRLADFYVLVSNGPGTTPGGGAVFEHFESGQAGTLTTVPVGASGRYVRVQLSGTGILSLAEVQVWGPTGP